MLENVEYYRFDNFTQIFPLINKLSLENIPTNVTFIGAAGFEDRCFSFIDEISGNNIKFNNILGIEYEPYNPRNRTKEFKAKIEKLKLNKIFWLIYHRYNPVQFYHSFNEIKNEVCSSQNIIIDISGMSKFLIIILLNILEDYEGNIHIIYSEANIYHPTLEEFEKEKKILPETTPTFLTKDIYSIITTSSLSSISMPGNPLLAIAFPTFNHKELGAILNEIMPQYLIEIEGIPHLEKNNWRVDAVKWINQKIERLNIKQIRHEKVSTFDYISLIKILDEIYQEFKYTHKCVIAPTGSKFQTIGVFLFKQLHPEIQIIYPIVKDFAEEFSEGYVNIWHLEFSNFNNFIRKLSEHRKFDIKLLKHRIEIKEENQINILHLSDIHLGNMSDAHKYIIQLETDLIKNLKIKKLDFFIISGDVGSISIQEEYKAAVYIIEEIQKQFSLNCDNIIVVPGNHDLNWDLSKKAYISIENDEYEEQSASGKCIIKDDTGIFLRNDELYKKRFENFSKHLFKIIFGKFYPEDYCEQGILSFFPNEKIVILALNSSWEIDHFKENLKKASINMDALSDCLHQLLDSKYDDWLKFVVLHHPVKGGEIIRNNEILELLADHQFQLCFHGHIHEATQEEYFRDKYKHINIIGAGTFGAPIGEQVPGIPLQYNVLRYIPDDQCIIVETRKKEKSDGAWSADARWEDANNPSPRYSIKLQKI